jgi:DNA-binding MarR family transcriptional regulator
MQNEAPKKTEAGIWLSRRDKWMRELIASDIVSRNGKLAGLHIALRLSAKKPSCYPAIQTMGKELKVSARQVARALKELEDEGFIRVRRVPGHSSFYSLDL